jgi:hypothetical protein
MSLFSIEHNSRMPRPLSIVDENDFAALRLKSEIHAPQFG